MRIGRLVTLSSLFALLALAPATNAETVAFDNPVQSGNQSYTGSLGLDFDVLSDPIEILSLGAFDSDGDGFTNPVTVGIYDRNTATLLFPSYTFDGTLQPLINGSRFYMLSQPFVLGPGQYSVVAWGYGPQDLNGNEGCVGVNGGDCFGNNPYTPATINNGGGAISVVGTGRYGLYGAYPIIADSGPANRYLAGTFTFRDANEVPEPATLGLMGLGILGMVAVARRRR